ncbi:MAG: hypothetical protein ABIL11_14980 [Chloroflexota bacterium]
MPLLAAISRSASIPGAGRGWGERQILNSHQVEYLLIGDYAVGYHGYPRATGDMDIWIAIHPQNAEKVVTVLREFGFDLPELSVELFLTA